MLPLALYEIDKRRNNNIIKITLIFLIKLLKYFIKFKNLKKDISSNKYNNYIYKY
jgi:hypothetical protein